MSEVSEGFVERVVHDECPREVLENPQTLGAWKKIAALMEWDGRDVIRLMVSSIYPRSGAQKAMFSTVEYELIKKILTSYAADRNREILEFYLLQRTKDPGENERISNVVFKTISETPRDSLLSAESIKKLMNNYMVEYGDKDPVFWENLSPDGNIAQMSSPQANCVADPATGEEYIVKPKDALAENNYTDPRIVLFFQKIARYYGLKMVPELVVLPSSDFYQAQGRAELLDNMIRFNADISYPSFRARAGTEYEQKKGQGLRVAKKVGPFKIAPKDPETKKWFPEEIFDDTREEEYMFIYRGGSRMDTREYKGNYFSADKFKAWYEALDDAGKTKFRESILPLYKMVNDGFFVDLFGGLNFGIKDGEFILIDVEPLALSNIPQFALCVPHSQKIMNVLFTAVELPEIKFSEVIKKNYGKSRELSLKKVVEPYVDNETAHSSKAGQVWETDVTHKEELAHYKDVYLKLVAERGELEEKDFPIALRIKHQVLLQLALEEDPELFRGKIYDWTNIASKRETSRII